MPAVRPAKRFALMVRVVISCLVVLVWWYAAKSQDPAVSDATADWILVNAVGTGLSPFEDVRTLGDKLGVPYRSLLQAVTTEPILHYRTAGGLLLLSPLIVIDWSVAHILMGVMGMFCFLWMLLVQSPRYCQVPVEQLLFPLALASVSAAFLETTYWGALSAIVAALTIATVLRAGEPSAGIPLAIATVLKLYPGLLFIPLLLKRQRAWRVGVVVLATCTVVGAAVFSLSLSETARLLVQGSKLWLTSGGNVSLGAMFTGPTGPLWIFPAVVVIGIVLVAMYSREHPLSQALAFAIPVSVLVNPVSWVHYDVVLIPLVLWLWTRRKYALGRYAAITWLVFQAIASSLTDLGAIDFVRIGVFGSRILVALAIAFAPVRLWEAQDRARSLQLTA